MDGGIDNSRKLDVTVLMGGPSSEREVSMWSGRAVADALEKLGYNVTAGDISPGDLSILDRDNIDVVFIALHGQFGESGQVQQLCVDRKLPYIGSKPRPSQLAMDKAASKQIFKQAGLLTPDWMIIESFHSPDVYKAWLGEFDLPVVLKPVDGGSSFGVVIASDAQTRDDALEELLDTEGRVLIEKFVHGREITVGILGEETLPILEVVPGAEFYDFDAKYAADSGTKYNFDLGLGQDLIGRINTDAMTAHRSLGCRDLSRVDFILDENDDPQVLEINTIPGFTSHSLVPMAAARAGIGFDELVDRLIKLALMRR